MSTPASIARHPIHPMLVAFPIGLWVFSVIADLIFQLGSRTPNLVALAIFGASFWLRWIKTMGFLPVGFSIAGLILLRIAGWLGGELVFIHNTGVISPKQQARETRTGSRGRVA